MISFFIASWSFFKSCNSFFNYRISSDSCWKRFRWDPLAVTWIISSGDPSIFQLSWGLRPDPITLFSKSSGDHHLFGTHAQVEDEEDDHHEAYEILSIYPCEKSQSLNHILSFHNFHSSHHICSSLSSNNSSNLFCSSTMHFCQLSFMPSISRSFSILINFSFSQNF